MDKVHIAPFGRESAGRFVREYFHGAPKIDAATRSKILDDWEIESRKAFDGLEPGASFGNPLSLALLCEAVAGANADLPSGKRVKSFSDFSNPAVLYEAVARMRLEKWEFAPHKSDTSGSRPDRWMSEPERKKALEAKVESLMVALGQLAFLMAEGNQIGERDLASVLPLETRKVLGEAGSGKRDLVGPLGLVMRYGQHGELRFCHEKFREYFAIRHARRVVDAGVDLSFKAVARVCGNERSNFEMFNHFPNANPRKLKAWLRKKQGGLGKLLVGKQKHSKKTKVTKELYKFFEGAIEAGYGKEVLRALGKVSISPNCFEDSDRKLYEILEKLDSFLDKKSLSFPYALKLLLEKIAGLGQVYEVLEFIRKNRL